MKYGSSKRSFVRITEGFRRKTEANPRSEKQV
jgi:hypothetical protein